jgi:hypothetical protein
VNGRPGETIELPDDPDLRCEIEEDLRALSLGRRIAIIKSLEVFGPDAAIPKERVRVIDKLHDVYVLPHGKRGPFAVVVKRGEDDCTILAGVCETRPSDDEAEALAGRALGL